MSVAVSSQSTPISTPIFHPENSVRAVREPIPDQRVSVVAHQVLDDSEVLKRAREGEAYDSAVKSGLNAILVKAKAAPNISSQRATMIAIASVNLSHYSSNIEHAVEALVDCLEKDPCDQASANGLLEVAKGLAKLLNSNDFSNGSLSLRIPFIRAFYLSLQLIVRQHGEERIAKVTKKDKEMISSTQSSLSRLTSSYTQLSCFPISINREVEFLLASIKKSIVFIEDDKGIVEEYKEYRAKVQVLITAYNNVKSGELFGALEKIESIWSDITDLFRKDWHKGIIALLKHEKSALEGSTGDLSIIQKKAAHLWPTQPIAAMAVVEMLIRITKHTKDIGIRQLALFGKKGSTLLEPGLLTYYRFTESQHIKKILMKYPGAVAPHVDLPLSEILEVDTLAEILERRGKTLKDRVDEGQQGLQEIERIRNLMLGERRSPQVSSLKSYQNGDIYYGVLVNEQRHGMGIYKFSNGDVYDGEWFEGKMQGKGFRRWADGRVYDGSWYQNEKHGRGVLLTRNKDIYSGQFFQDMLQGKGIYLWKDKTRYEGNLVNAKNDGAGIISDRSGEFFEGKWKKDKRSGLGIQRLPRGALYEDTYSNDSLVSTKMKFDPSLLFKTAFKLTEVFR